MNERNTHLELVKTQGQYVERMDMCAVLSPYSFERTGKYPDFRFQPELGLTLP